MKRFLLICCLLPLFCFAETIDIELTCFDTDKLFTLLKTSYIELPIITGRVEDQANSIMTLWINAENKSWTIVATIDEKSCVVGYGKKFSVINLVK